MASVSESDLEKIKRLQRHIESCKLTVKLHQTSDSLIPSIPINCILSEEAAKEYPTAAKDRSYSCAYDGKLCCKTFKNYTEKCVRRLMAKPSKYGFWLPSKYPAHSESMLEPHEDAYTYIILPSKWEMYL